MPNFLLNLDNFAHSFLHIQFDYLITWAYA